MTAGENARDFWKSVFSMYSAAPAAPLAPNIAIAAAAQLARFIVVLPCWPAPRLADIVTQAAAKVRARGGCTIG
jgi:hypothetical protein